MSDSQSFSIPFPVQPPMAGSILHGLEDVINAQTGIADPHLIITLFQNQNGQGQALGRIVLTPQAAIGVAQGMIEAAQHAIQVSQQRDQARLAQQGHAPMPTPPPAQQSAPVDTPDENWQGLFDGADVGGEA